MEWCCRSIGIRNRGRRLLTTTTPSGDEISRDPLQEWGGINLYGFVGNSPLSRVDLFGLAGDVVIPPGGDFPMPPNWPRGELPPTTPSQPGPLDGACETITDNSPEVLKETIKLRAETPVGRREPIPPSGAGKIGTIGGVAGGFVEAGTGLSQAAPGLAKIGLTVEPRNKAIRAEGDEFWEMIDKLEEKKVKCRNLNEKDND